MSTPIRYALIGFGGIAVNRIAKEGFACDHSRFAPLADVELVGATNRSASRADAVRTMGITWYPTVEDVLADSSVDAVFIATNNATHAKYALQALAAGKHVLTEKPISPSLEDAEKMVAEAKKRNLSLGINHMMVYNSYNQLAQKSIQDGMLGTINDACIHMDFGYGFTPEEAAAWRCNDVAEMGGPIGDVASHCAYMAEYLLGGTITSVQAAYLPKHLAIKAENGAEIYFELSNGKTGTIHVAFSTPRGGLAGTISNLGYEIYGDKGILRCYGGMFQLSGHADEPYPIRLEADLGTDGVKNLVPDTIQNIYQQSILHHAQSIRDNKPLTGEDGLHNLKLCLAMHQSAQNNGKKITIE